MHWKIKASIQKILSLTHVGDVLNHIPVTMSSKYHENVCLYQFYECIRKFKLSEVKFSYGKPLSALEIGTGYSIIASVVLSLLGFKKIVSVDISNDLNLKSFLKEINFLELHEVWEILLNLSIYDRVILKNKISNLKSARKMKDIFNMCNIVYIPNYKVEDIDRLDIKFQYIFSQVVFEHISPNSLSHLFNKFNEWMDDSCISVHTVNFIDHFANPGLFQDKSISEFNFLKYSDKQWAFWAGNNIAFTNRLSYIYYIDLCEGKGFKLLNFIGENYRPHNPLSQEEIHEDVFFKYQKTIGAEDLCKYQRGTYVLCN